MFGRRWRLFRLCGIPVAAPELDGEFRLPDQPSRRAVSEQHVHHTGNGRGYV